MTKSAKHGRTKTGLISSDRRYLGPVLSLFVVLTGGTLALPGCFTTPVAKSDLDLGPAPRRIPSPEREEEGKRSYEDRLTGAQVFSMYCSYCHNAPALSERPFSNMQNVANHMRVRANLTGKEYAKLMEFLRRIDDVPPPNPAPPPSPKRFIFSQPINELREEAAPAPQPKLQGAVPTDAPQGDAPRPIILPLPDEK